MSNLALKGAGIIHGSSGTPVHPSNHGPNEGHHVHNNIINNMLGPRYSVE